ncbi:MAG: cation diffusion facilitator family transporter [bacterium]|nr:cation diffusion facilitator family transporter [bacterium]
MNSTDPTSHANQEKKTAAASSVIAAVALTGMKLVVGLLTGSLGILAEAAHSALDLVAAIVTLIAVRLSGRPADPEHLYGHGKIENLSALVETALLLLTCVWIIAEAVRRLFFARVEVEVNFWSFTIMAVSIVVDISRSRMLYRVARKHNSQALEADALHFSTDIWSSGVVIAGLLGMKMSDWFPRLEFFHQADAAAAVVVALIVVAISVQLGIRTVRGLIDAAPAGMREEIIAAIEAMPGVVDCHRVRIRYSGPQFFVDAHVSVKGDTHLDDVHALMDGIERRIRQLIPGADVTVHPEPSRISPREAAMRIEKSEGRIG